MKTQTRKITFLLAAITLFCSTGIVHAESYPALPEALTALQWDNATSVIKVAVPSWSTNGYYYLFLPKEKAPTKGFIFYPGGAVDPRAYAPPLHALAAKGYLAVLVAMPNDLAFFGHKRARDVINAYPDITTWALGGHSLGGVASCWYAKQFTDTVAGVVLWASYPSSTFSLARKQIRVMSIYGSKDGLTTLDEIEDSKQDLPADTQFVEITGGNHTQFGWYEGEPDTGLQKNDNPADITREEQQAQVVEATAGFLEQL